MTSAHNPGLWLLAMSLSLNSPAGASPQPLPSTIRSTQLSDEEMVRQLTETYGLAISAGDLDHIRELWNPASPVGEFEPARYRLDCSLNGQSRSGKRRSDAYLAEFV